MAEIDGEELDHFQPIFDPVAFQKEYPDPKVGDYALTEEQLLEKGILVTSIRAQI